MATISKDEIIKLPEEYVLINKYTLFLYNEGKSCLGEDYMLICWYIGNISGRLIGVYWKEKEEAPWFLTYENAGNGTLSLYHKMRFKTWSELFYCFWLSPKSYYAPSMAHVFNSRILAPCSCGKIIQFPNKSKEAKI